MAFFTSETQPIPQEFFEKFKKAIVSRDITTIKEYINEANHKKYNLNQNDPKSKYTLLHFAVTKTNKVTENEMIEILKLLRENGVDLNRNTIDKSHFVPLHTAARRLLPETVKWLLDNGADRTIKDLKNDEPYQTPLEYVEKLLSLDHEAVDNRERLTEMADILTSYTRAKESDRQGPPCTIL